MIAIFLQWSAIIFDLIHYWKYTDDGKGFVTLEALSVIFEMGSECTMILLLYMLANGWMTYFMDYDVDAGIDQYGPLFLLIVATHIVMGGYALSENDAHHRFHDFTGLLGYILIAIKLILVFIFFWFHINTQFKLKQKHNEFMSQLLYIGMGYLLSDPFVIVSSFLLAEVNR